MKRSTWWLCNMILYLDRIPRYGRLYRLEDIPEDPDSMTRDWKKAAAIWTWQRHGHWGINLLDRMGLMWRWLDEAERRYDAAPRSVPGRTDDGD
jgi:hypothetical protein